MSRVRSAATMSSVRKNGARNFSAILSNLFHAGREPPRRGERACDRRKSDLPPLFQGEDAERIRPASPNKRRADECAFKCSSCVRQLLTRATGSTVVELFLRECETRALLSFALAQHRTMRRAPADPHPRGNRRRRGGENILHSRPRDFAPRRRHSPANVQLCPDYAAITSLSICSITR